ncbi:hypothetical protein [Streptomyces sp. S1]|uniref:hypothetical protein n=1 Tax=Streptomyces sp. S1 TaxID=718288 RepID=UPI003D74C495
MAISFVNDASWTTNVNGSGYTITKPSSTTTGDLLVAFLAINLYPSGSTVTVNVPSGWTKQEDVLSSPNLRVAVMTRVAGGSEPSSWAGTLSASREQRVTICATYRGASSLAVEGGSSTGSATSLSTPTVSNPSVSNWRMVFGAYASGSAGFTIGSNEVINRHVDQATGGGGGAGAVQAGLWDSNGTVGSGNTSRNVTRGAVWESAAAWIGILDATDTAIPGTLTATLPLVGMSAAASLGYSGTLAASLPTPTMTAAGIASPAEGPLDVVVLPAMTAQMYTDAQGALAVLLLPAVAVQAETRHFGVRVVTPARESRVVRPRLGTTD